MYYTSWSSLTAFFICLFQLAKGDLGSAKPQIPQLAYIVSLNKYQVPISDPVLSYIYKINGASLIKPWFYDDVSDPSNTDASLKSLRRSQSFPNEINFNEEFDDEIREDVDEEEDNMVITKNIQSACIFRLDYILWFGIIVSSRLFSSEEIFKKFNQYLSTDLLGLFFNSM